MKKVRADKTQERAKTKERKEAIRTIPELIKVAQTAFNAYVRERDKHLECISCGQPPRDDYGYHKGRDCGHLRSIGAASHLRFHEDNAHAQCVKCNQWKAGNVVEYRLRLIQRIGIERVESLESNNEPHKWTREELIQIAATYREKIKQLKAVQNDS